MYKVICQNCGHEKIYNTPYKKNQSIHSCFRCGGNEFTIEIGHITEIWEVERELNYDGGAVSSEDIFTSTQVNWFKAYKKVQDSGKFNMITEALKAMEEARLSKKQYQFVVDNYKGLSEQTGERV